MENEILMTSAQLLAAIKEKKIYYSLSKVKFNLLCLTKQGDKLATGNVR